MVISVGFVAGADCCGARFVGRKILVTIAWSIDRSWQIRCGVCAAVGYTDEITERIGDLHQFGKSIGHVGKAAQKRFAAHLAAFVTSPQILGERRIQPLAVIVIIARLGAALVHRVYSCQRVPRVVRSFAKPRFSSPATAVSLLSMRSTISASVSPSR